mgnify:FL=1
MQQTYIEKQTRRNYYLLQSNIPLINHNAAVACHVLNSTRFQKSLIPYHVNSIGVTETKTFLLSHDDYEFRKMIYLFCMYWYFHISVHNRLYRSMLSLPRS